MHSLYTQFARLSIPKSRRAGAIQLEKSTVFGELQLVVYNRAMYIRPVPEKPEPIVKRFRDWFKDLPTWLRVVILVCSFFAVLTFVVALVNMAQCRDASGWRPGDASGRSTGNL